MRLARPVLLALALGLALASPASAKQPCTSGGKTVAQNRYLRLYTKKGDASESRVRLYACDRKTRKRRKLAEAFDDGYVSSEEFHSVRLHGRYAAFVDHSYDISCKAACPPGYEADSYSIGVYASRSGKTRFIGPDSSPTALVLTVKGAIAWAEGSGGAVKIQARDSAGTRTLDTGAIDPRSLGVELTIVSWTKDGEERFARLR